jgi:hypothetical protein
MLKNLKNKTEREAQKKKYQCSDISKFLSLSKKDSDIAGLLSTVDRYLIKQM